MSNISMFFKKNKPKKENVFYAATSSLKDEKGNPLKWEIKPLTTKENELIQDKCMLEIPIGGKTRQYRSKIDHTKYITQLLVNSIVFPDLLNAELQDSYGVKTPEDLIKEMIDNIGEYTDFVDFVNKFNGFDTDLDVDEEIETAKN